MTSVLPDLRLLESLIPSEGGLTVFDAETQETSYGIRFLGEIPYIFDTHRIRGYFVATIELLTEVVEPIRISQERLRRFCVSARHLGLLPIPYSACFFRENLHVYSFSDPVRGFDLAAVGRTVLDSELRLWKNVEGLSVRIPKVLLQAQRDLLVGRRRARYVADLKVLVRQWNHSVQHHRRQTVRRKAQRDKERRPRVYEVADPSASGWRKNRTTGPSSSTSRKMPSTDK